jgi:hypothetical protein
MNVLNLHYGIVSALENKVTVVVQGSDRFAVIADKYSKTTAEAENGSGPL